MFKKVLDLVALLTLIISVTASAQDALTLFSKDTAAVVELDLQTLSKVLSKENRANLLEMGNIKAGLELSDYVSTVYFGVDQKNKGYMLLKSKYSAKELVDTLLELGEADVEYEAATVAGLNGYKFAGDEGPYVLSKNDGFVVIGTEQDIKKYVSVGTGVTANASGNMKLKELAARVKTLPICIYGAPEAGKNDVASIAGGLAYNDETMGISLFLEMDDATKIAKLQESIIKMKELLPMVDTSGKLTEIYNTMKMEADGKTIDVLLTVPQGTVEYINENSQQMMMGMLMVGSQMK